MRLIQPIANVPNESIWLLECMVSVKLIFVATLISSLSSILPLSLSLCCLSHKVRSLSLPPPPLPLSKAVVLVSPARWRGCPLQKPTPHPLLLNPTPIWNRNAVRRQTEPFTYIGTRWTCFLRIVRTFLLFICKALCRRIYKSLID